MSADLMRRADIERERNEVWLRAIRERMKYVTITVCRTWTPTSIKNYVAVLKPLAAFTAVVGERHRVFCASADLAGEELNPEP